MTRLIRLVLSATILLTPFYALAEAPATPAPTATVKSITIYAAASLKNALDDVAVAWKAKTGDEVKISYAGSMLLAKQIEAGAPADVFISADLASMDYLAERKLIVPGSRSNFLGNTLVAVAPKTSPLTQLSFKKAAWEKAIGTGRIALGDPASVPAGKYAKAAFEKLGLWDLIEAHSAFTDNVRGALVFVAREEAPLAAVYATDAASEPKVKIVATFPKDSHPPIVYPLALTSTASGETPKQFLSFLKSPEGVRAFTKQGFAILH